MKTDNNQSAVMTGSEPSLNSIDSNRFVNVPDFKITFDAIIDRLANVYGIGVIVGPVPGPFIGQLDGKDIWIDFERDNQEAVFTLAHLFGHTVQWSIDEKLRQIALREATVREEDFPRIYQYERQASQYGLTLLQDVGAGVLARWLTNRFGADWKFLKHFYLTGEKLRFELAEGADEPILEALAIPPFRPRLWAIRGAF